MPTKGTKDPSTANEALVGTLITIGDVNDIFAIRVDGVLVLRKVADNYHIFGHRWLDCFSVG